MAQKICLVDGSGYIFRAYYGLPPLTAPDGTPVNAVYGFTNMFFRLTQKLRCDYNLVLFDAKRQNFRNQIFPDYKATRKDIPEELIPQFPIIREAVSTLKLNMLEMEGYEADDLIATYCAKALAADLEVVIVSADKDLMQLIRPGVEFYDPMKDKFFTPEDVKEKFGVYPEHVADVQALSGDSTDNVPGVPGIGPKTAAELVNAYGSLAGVLEHAGEIKQNKRRETILANIENARISLQLVTLRDDVPVEKSPRDYIFHCPDMDLMSSFINKYGFFSLAARAGKWVEEQCSRADPQAAEVAGKKIVANYTLLSDAAALQKWIAEHILPQKGFAIKVLAGGNNPMFEQAAGVALAAAAGDAAYIPFADAKQDASVPDLFSAPESSGLKIADLQKLLLPLLQDEGLLKIGHNIKSDMHFLAKIFGNDFKLRPYDDVEVISYVLDSSEHPHDVKNLAALFLGCPMQNPDTVFGVGKQKLACHQVAPEVLTPYVCEIADMILRLHALLRPRLLNEHMVTVYEYYDRPLVATLFDMEKNGVRINSNALRQLSRDFATEQNKLEQEAFALAGEEFNLGSPKQIGEILYNKLGLKGKKNSGGAFQTGAEVLEQMAESHPLPAKILSWRAVSKLKSTYTDALPELCDRNDRVHTTYSQTTVNTGRLSSVNPNLQNIPVRSEEGLKIRRAFVASPECKLISADYSQVELRLMAVVADVKGLKEAFAAGEDIHTATAMKIFSLSKDEVTPNIRRHAKAINFGIIYGISQYGLAKQIGSTPQEAKRYIDTYFEKLPEIKQYMEKTIDFARKHGYVVTPFGRKCAVAGINDKNRHLAAFAERAAINAPLQGGAADIMKRAMNSFYHRLRAENSKAKILLQVHDELVVEAPLAEAEKVAAMLKETMENVVNYDVKFVAEVGIGDNWAEAH